MSEFELLRELKIDYGEEELPIRSAQFVSLHGSQWFIEKYVATNHTHVLNFKIKCGGGIFTKPDALALAALIKKMAEELPEGETDQ